MYVCKSTVLFSLYLSRGSSVYGLSSKIPQNTRLMMSSSSKAKKFYAVAVGRTTGIFETWDACKKQVLGFTSSKYKSFKTREEAQAFINEVNPQAQQIDRVELLQSVPIAAIDDAPQVTDVKKRASKSMNETETKETAKKVKEEAQVFVNDVNPQQELIDRIAFFESDAIDDDPRVTYVKKQVSTSMSMDETNETIKTVKSEPTCDNKFLDIRIAFDGGSRGNPGLSGSGASLELSEVNPTNESAPNLYRRVYHIREYIGNFSTNNEAEYQGLIRALIVAHFEATQYCIPPAKLVTNITIKGDSQLILNQLIGTYQCKKENLKVRYRKVKQILDDFKKLGGSTVAFEHTLRALNKQADGFANEAMDTRRSWITTSEDGHKQQRLIDSFVKY